jgi:hypothetical protein
MHDPHRAGRVRAWLADPLFREVFDGLETAAINRAVYWKPGEEEKRDVALLEVRAIRSFRSKLNAIVVDDEAKSNERDEPA